MDTILVKLLAAFLTLSQVATRPDSIKTTFDPVRDVPQVAQIMRDGCAHMRRAFDVESIDLDDLIKTAMDDPEAISTDVKALHGLKFDSLIAVYRQFCKNETIPNSPVDLGEVIRFYDAAVADLPDQNRLKGARLAGNAGILDGRGERFADLTESNRRIWVPLKDIPVPVQKAFIAAEDKRFYEHKGIDERGLIRAMVTNLASPGRPQGGSTITQQVVKNLLVGDNVTYERKMREMILAARLERTLSKSEILELYLNSIYLGRGAWGIELAARNFFGKSASALTLQEGAMLAGLPKGPTYYGPDRHPDRARERLAYVLSRMQEDGDQGTGAVDGSAVVLPRMVAYTPPAQRDSGYYFLDHISREARTAAGIGLLGASATTVRTTIRPELQRAAEAALQEGLAQYEIRNARTEWHGPEANLAEAIRRIEAARLTAVAEPAAPFEAKPPAVDPFRARAGAAAAPAGARRASGPPAATPPANRVKPAWQQALAAARLPLYDVHWTPAVVLAAGGSRVGLADGRVLPLSSVGRAGRRGLSLYDVVLVKLVDQGKQAYADLRVRPTVQGSAVVLDNKTGAILAMVGGFSYPMSQLNRVTQAVRQPGSSLKPFTYLAALRAGLQPNTLVRDEPLTLPPIGYASRVREKDYWSPKNADGGGSGITTLRRGLENSKNLVTAHLLDGGINSDPSQSLSQVCELTRDAQIYRECVPYYPFVLGAQPARLIDLAAFYTAIATEGRRPTPYGIESIEQNGRAIYTHKPEVKWLASGDRPAFFQLRTMLQGVVARGTARAIGHLSSFVGGKTGTSDDENDAWFIGFTNDVTIGVWVGYDNAEGIRRTLGHGETGGHLAVPIFERIVQATWASYAGKTPLNPPSPEARKELVAMTIDLNSGNQLSERGGRGFTEYFRARHGRVEETQYQLVSRDDVGDNDDDDDNEVRYRPSPPVHRRVIAPRPAAGYYAAGAGSYTNAPPAGGLFAGGLFGGLFAPPQRQAPAYYGAYGDQRQRGDDRRWTQPRRVNPDVLWQRY